MPRKHGSSKKTIQANTQELIRSGRKPDQAYAIANKWAKEDKGGKKKGRKK